MLPPDGATRDMWGELGQSSTALRDADIMFLSTGGTRGRAKQETHAGIRHLHCDANKGSHYVFIDNDISMTDQSIFKKYVRFENIFSMSAIQVLSQLCSSKRLEAVCF